MSPKDKMLVLRISEEDKMRIEEAAKKGGRSITDFIVGASLAESKRAAKRTVAGVHRGIPTWFRALCSTAAQGGSTGYEDAGYRLALSLDQVMPYGVEPKAWNEQVELLLDACDAIDESGKSFADFVTDRDPELAEAVWGWFQQHFPAMMELVPARRKLAFVYGVLLGYWELKSLSAT